MYFNAYWATGKETAGFEDMRRAMAAPQEPGGRNDTTVIQTRLPARSISRTEAQFPKTFSGYLRVLADNCAYLRVLAKNSKK
jgi:hypothetical protein